ncbi:hypothetical protein Celal_1468 [Cellulophaga algicola DSM 14237]|uniref:Uncharacterized protein n=1 Tax=Cellulophaga algicola (strain DSM 14237 / IC166 / ACAM 630) TaxID=688270 RepID=E6X9N0_CELAD|nr:hypothetical protein Celal_1468 [Cellulophaga algicola DSM 14237]
MSVRVFSGRETYGKCIENLSQLKSFSILMISPLSLQNHSLEVTIEIQQPFMKKKVHQKTSMSVRVFFRKGNVWKNVSRTYLN